MSQFAGICRFALAAWAPARSVGVHAHVLLHGAARRPEVATAGEDARATNSAVAFRKLAQPTTGFRAS